MTEISTASADAGTGRGPGGSRTRSFPVYVRAAGTTTWRRGRAVWVRDVLAVHAGPGGRRTALLRVATGQERTPTSDERWWIHRHGGGMVVGTFWLHDGGAVHVATLREHRSALFRPLCPHEAA